MQRNRSNRFHAWRYVGYVVANSAMALLLTVDAGGQTDSLRETHGAVARSSEGERTLDETTSVVVDQARRQLEHALADNDANIRGPAMRQARALHQPWIAEIVLPVCESPDLTERVLALEAIAATNPEIGREVFLSALGHRQRSVRLRGLLGLEALGDPSTVIDLIGVLEREEDPDLKVVAARALGSIGDIGSSSALRAAIESPHAPLREQAVLALLAIGKEDVGRYLLRILGSGQRPGTVETLELIALVPDPTLIHLLEPFLESEDSRARSQAAVAILSILERSGTSGH